MSESPTPDPSWKGLPSWLFFAFFVIGPAAALVAFTRTLTQNPVLIALLVVVYEILLFVLRFTGKIWQQLEEKLVPYIVQWLTVGVEEVVSRYYRHYCQYLVYEHQVFDVKGLSTRTAHDLELEQVFVDLRINPIPPHRASADLLHLPESLQGRIPSGTTSQPLPWQILIWLCLVRQALARRRCSSTLHSHWLNRRSILDDG